MTRYFVTGKILFLFLIAVMAGKSAIAGRENRDDASYRENLRRLP